MTKLILECDMNGDIRFKGEISGLEMLRVALDPIDRAVVNTVTTADKGGKQSEMLLALEILFRRLEEQRASIKPQFPATVTMHCPSGPTNACDDHAQVIRNLFAGMWGTQIQSTPAPEGSECDNCVNVAKTKGTRS